MANFGDQCAAGGGNAFVNDGSFMEMFKRLQEQQKEKGEESTTAEDKEEPNSASKPSASGGPEASVSDSNNRTHETEASDKDKASDKKSAERTAVTTDPPLVKASQVVINTAFSITSGLGLVISFPVHCSVPHVRRRQKCQGTLTHVGGH